MRRTANENPSWSQRVEWAQAEVEATLAALPRRLRAAARALPVTYARRPSQALLADGIEPDTLGLFVGGEFAEGAHAILPAQILLFLDNLWEAAEEDPEWFCDEVRTTLLHELGHYLGLNEEDLEIRGLD